MDAKKVLTIDLNKWQTQQEAANSYTSAKGVQGCTVQYISKLVRQNKIEHLDLPQIGIVLVKR